VRRILQGDIAGVTKFTVTPETALQLSTDPAGAAQAFSWVILPFTFKTGEANTFAVTAFVTSG